jgi:hypothetical protein
VSTQNIPVIFTNVPVNRDKPSLVSSKFLLKAPKYAKQFAGVFQIKARLVVFYIKNLQPLIIYRAFFNLWFFILDEYLSHSPEG